jgi:hypothetical protein
MPDFRFSFSYPDHLDDRLVDHLENIDITIADARSPLIVQERSTGRRVDTSAPVDSRSRCAAVEIVTLSADARTVDGRWELDVRPTLCFEDLRASYMFGEPSIVATPVVGRPTLTSIGFHLSDASRDLVSRDLVLRVFTTDLGGQPVDQYFHWHAVIPMLADLI